MAKKNSSPAKPKHQHHPFDEEGDEPEEAPRGPSPVAKIRRQVFRPSWLLLLAIALLGGLFGPRLKNRLPDLTEREEYRLRVENVHLNEMPHWIPHDLVAQVAKIENWESQPLSLLEEDCCEQIATAFRRHPWVKEVDQVRLRPGASGIDDCLSQTRGDGGSRQREILSH